MRCHSARATGPSSGGHSGASDSGPGSFLRRLDFRDVVVTAVHFFSGSLIMCSFLLIGVGYGCEVEGLRIGFIEAAPVTGTFPLLAGECLPPPHGNVDKEWIDFDSRADPAGRLRRDQCGAAAKKRVINRVADAAVVEQGTTH